MQHGVYPPELFGFFPKTSISLREFLTASLFHLPLHTLYRTTASRSSETVPRPAASEGAPHRAGPSFAAAHSWLGSAPRRPPTTCGPVRSANPPASDSCRWLPCRSAPAPPLAGRTVPRRPRPVPASALRSLPSPCPTNSLVASWDENHIL